MSDAVTNLKNWFDRLERNQQIDVVQFLYGGKALITEGLYCGPVPGLVSKGLFCGPAPTSSVQTGRCPTCGRPM